MVVPEAYVDVNVFVYWLGGHPRFGETARRWVKRIERAPRGRYVTSSLTLYEVSVIIAGLSGRSLRDESLIRTVIGQISSLPGLSVLPLTEGDCVRAASAVEEYDLDYEDALHLAVALRSGTKKIISNDQDYERTPLERIFTE